MFTIKKVKLIKIGNSMGFIVPMDYVKQNELELDKEYSLVINETRSKG